MLKDLPEQSTGIFGCRVANLAGFLGIIFRFWQLTAVAVFAASEVQISAAFIEIYL